MWRAWEIMKSSETAKKKHSLRLRQRNLRACKTPIKQRLREEMEDNLFSQFHFEPVLVPALLVKRAREPASERSHTFVPLSTASHLESLLAPFNYSLEQHVLVSFMGSCKKGFLNYICLRSPDVLCVTRQGQENSKGAFLL